MSLWGNDFSNMTALFELADGGAMRSNEFRRVGYWNGHESRFRFYGTDQVFEQSGHGATLSVKTEGEDYAKGETRDISHLFFTHGAADPRGLRGRRPGPHAELRLGHRARAGPLAPSEGVRGCPQRARGRPPLPGRRLRPRRHHRTHPPVHAWKAARFTLPGVLAYDSARQGGARLAIPDFGDGPSDPGLGLMLR